MFSQSSKTSKESAVEQLQQKLFASLDKHISEGATVGLFNAPDYPNVGDSAIFLGTLAYLKQRKANVTYICATRNYDSKAAQKALDGGIVLLQGGGNFGDAWIAHQTFRERVIRDFPNNQILQMPQSFSFKEPTSIRHAASALESHKNLTLLFRDDVSLELAQKTFNVNIEECCDAAFGLGYLGHKRSPSPKQNLLILKRDDPESATAGEFVEGTVDWLRERPSIRLRALLSDLRFIRTNNQTSRARCMTKTLENLASMRVDYGCNLLSKGHVVVTDRLHASIMSGLLGIPCVMIGDRHGKLLNFYQKWLADTDLVMWSTSFAEGTALGQTTFRQIQQEITE